MNGPILLVEDDEPLRKTIARHLRAGGREVLEADSAEDALEQLASGVAPSLVILDINLPGETGWDLLRSEVLRAAGDPPVVVATVTGIRPRKLREFGVAGYLPKPFPLDTLMATVQRLTGDSE